MFRKEEKYGLSCLIHFLQNRTKKVIFRVKKVKQKKGRDEKNPEAVKLCLSVYVRGIRDGGLGEEFR